MATYKPLPLEILTIILQQLGSAKEIGECRLVCKAWNDPAERAMFSKPLIVLHEDKAEKLIQYLEKNPAKGRYITSLTVTDYDDQRVMERFLQLAFTPSIERMDGKVLDVFSSATQLNNPIYTTMIEIAENSPIKFDRLKTIPLTFLMNDLYGKVLLAFKETLEVVQIPFFSYNRTQGVLHRFDEFKNLKALHLNGGEFSSIQELDRVLKGCHHLKELYLSVKIVDQTKTPDLPASSTVSSTAIWERMQVKKEPSLEKLTFVYPGYPLVIEYLLYKYPNIQDFRLDPMAEVEPSWSNDLTSLNFERILENIKRLKKYSLNFAMDSEDDWSEKVTAVKADINSLAIQYHTQFIEEEDEIYIRINVDTLENKTRKAHFVLEVPTIAAYFNPIDLVREVGIPLERLELNFVDLAALDGDQLFLEQLDRSEESSVFFDIMYDFPHIKEIKLTAHYLSEASDIFSTHDTIELRSLEICGAQVTQGALRCVSYECPQLKELKLVNCFLAPDNRQNTFHIRMDHTSFDHFIYTTVPIEGILLDKVDRDAKDHFSLVTSEMQNSWTSFNIYVWLGIKEAGKKIYFIIPLVHSKEENLSVCQELFDLRPVKESPLLHFTCFNIKSLCFQVGPVSFTIKEDMIRECVESSVMSYPLEKGDIDEEEE